MIKFLIRLKTKKIKLTKSYKFCNLFSIKKNYYQKIYKINNKYNIYKIWTLQDKIVIIKLNIIVKISNQSILIMKKLKNRLFFKKTYNKIRFLKVKKIKSNKINRSLIHKTMNKL